MKSKGSTSYVMVELGELNRILKWESGVRVPVMRRWAEALELKGKKFNANTKAVRELAEDSPEIKITNWA